MENNTIRILTRDSFLALAQTIQVSDYLMKKGFKIEIKALKTSGDVKLDAPLYQIAQQADPSNPDAANSKEGKAFFTKELEDGLLRNEGDLAVHSLKDLPTQLPEGLVFSSAIMPVECSDTIVTLDRLPENPAEQIRRLNALTVGTSSLRRIALLKRWLPEAKLSPVRGNLVTRLEKLLNRSEMDSLILATAGLKRLYAFYKLWEQKRDTWAELLDAAITERIDTDYRRLTHIFGQELFFYEMDPGVFPPAVSQGVLGVETRAADLEKLSKLFDTDKGLDNRIGLERKLLSQLEAGCHIPYGNHVQLKNLAGDTPACFGISTFYARNYDPAQNSDVKDGEVEFFTGERYFSSAYDQERVRTLVAEIKGQKYPVVFCGLKNEAFGQYLQKQNFITHFVPLIGVEANSLAPQLPKTCDVAVVVSKNSIDHFPETLPEAGHWVCVGEKTAEYLKANRGISNVKVPAVSDGLSSAKEVVKLTGGKPSRVTWFGAQNGKKDGIDFLRNQGYEVTVYEGYQSVPRKFVLPESVSHNAGHANAPGHANAKEENFIENQAWWVFTSPSSAQSYLDQNLHRSRHLVSVIGNSTAGVFLSRGIVPYHIAGKSDVLVMAEEIAGSVSQKTWKTTQWSL